MDEKTLKRVEDMDMGKYFNCENPIPKKTKTADGDSWKTLSMPEERIAIKINLTNIPEQAMNLIRKGHIPRAMGDHWFMYCDDDTIRYFRSWTGFCIYEAKYKKNGDGYMITSLTVNRNPVQYGGTNYEKDLYLFICLLISDAGGDVAKFRNAYISL